MDVGSGPRRPRLVLDLRGFLPWVAIEYEGIFSEKSGHTTLSGYKKDVEKYNLATKLGWKILRYTADNYFDFENDLKYFTVK